MTDIINDPNSLVVHQMYTGLLHNGRWEFLGFFVSKNGNTLTFSGYHPATSNFRYNVDQGNYTSYMELDNGYTDHQESDSDESGNESNPSIGDEGDDNENEGEDNEIDGGGKRKRKRKRKTKKVKKTKKNRRTKRR